MVHGNQDQNGKHEVERLPPWRTWVVRAGCGASKAMRLGGLEIEAMWLHVSMGRKNARRGETGQLVARE